MGKHMTFEPAEDEHDRIEAAEEPQDEHDARLARAGEQLQRLMTLVDGAIDAGNVTPALLREAASVTRAIVALSAEGRARQRFVVKAATQLRWPTVVAYLRGLPTYRLQELFEAATAENEHGSILG